MDDKAFGVPFSLAPFHGRVHPDFNDPELVKTLAGCRALLDSPAARILLDGRNRVAAVRLEAGRWDFEAVIKEFRASGFGKLKTFFTASKALKAWRGAAACVERGIPTPLPIAYLERREKGLVAECFFISERLEGRREIRFPLRDFPPEELRRLLSSAARFLSRCHDGGILHRDLSDGNILVSTDPGGGFLFSLIDTNRIRVRRRISVMRRMKNLIRLGVHPRYREYFLTEYMGGRKPGFFAGLWYRCCKRAYARQVALKKTLGLRKLAKRLGIQ